MVSLFYIGSNAAPLLHPTALWRRRVCIGHAGMAALGEEQGTAGARAYTARSGPVRCGEITAGLERITAGLERESIQRPVPGSRRGNWYLGGRAGVLVLFRRGES